MVQTFLLVTPPPPPETRSLAHLLRLDEHDDVHKEGDQRRQLDSVRGAVAVGLATGDVGRFEGGRLYINSRARDMILRAGENVYPVEIENRLDGHPDVAEVAVVGADHPELGQEVKAIVVPRPGATLDTDALAAWCREALSAYKVPSQWEVRADPLPRNAVGKVLKNVLTGEAEHAFVEE